MSGKNVVWLIVGIILIIAGAILLAVPGLDPVSSDSLETVTSADPDGITAIRVETDDLEIRIYDNWNSQIEVDASGMDPGRIEAWVDNGCLHIRQKADRSLFSFLQKDGAVIVWVPASFAGDLSVNATSGEISLSGVKNPDASAVVASSSGEVYVYDSAFASLSVNTVSGAVYAGDLEIGGKLEMNTSSGGVSLSGGRCGDVYVIATSGSVSLDDVRGDTVLSSSSSGSQYLDDVRASTLGLVTSSGSVDLRRTDARELTIETGSGSVYAELEGSAADYAADISTGSGSVSGIAPHTDGERPLRITTGSGSVDVSFEG